MTKVIAKTYDVTNSHKTQIIYALIAVCGILIVTYFVNIYSVISRSVAIEKVQSQMVESSAIVRELDQKYLELSSKITPDSLKQYGLREGREAAFISRTASLGSVAFGGNEL